MKHTMSWHFNNVQYKQPKLNYHNLAHVTNVAIVIDRLCDTYGFEDYKDYLILAGLYHDIVYVPGRSDNEKKSALYLLDIEPDMQYPAVLIEQTTVMNHISSLPSFEKDPDLCILLDADLSSMCKDFDAFVKQQEDILMENSIEVTEKHLSAGFLSTLTEKGFIFRTPECKKLFEKTAMHNCKKFIEIYGTE